MKNVLQKSLIAFSLVFSFIQCNEEDGEMNASESTSAATEVVNHQELWVQKFSQLETLPLSQKHLTLIGEMKALMIDYSSENNERLLDIGIALSKITSEKEFDAMFCTTEPYEIVQARRTSNEETETATFAESKLLEAKALYYQELEMRKNPSSNVSARACNCRWSCAWFDAFWGTRTTDCVETDTDCGFLLRYPCDEYVYQEKIDDEEDDSNQLPGDAEKKELNLK